MGPFRRSTLGRDVLYPNHYTWLVFIAAMDIMMTCTVIVFGGREVNAVAAFIIRRWGLPGMVLFKFVLVTVVIGVCEVIGRRDRSAGKWLACVAIAINSVPVALAFGLLLRKVH